MSHAHIVENTKRFVQQSLLDAEAGHDWWHIYRVWQNAKMIAREEQLANLLVVELGALLHDIADAKFHDGNETIATEKSRSFLQSIEVSNDIIEAVIFIIENISFRKSLKGRVEKTVELCVVQDADRLDALGAIGIARAFSYGGFKHRPIYDPAIPPTSNISYDTYVKSKAPTINHFYEKLLLLKDQMNTPVGRRMAGERHAFMQEYLKQFYQEWPASQP